MSDGWRDDRDWPPEGSTAKALWELDDDEIEQHFDGPGGQQ